MSEGAIHDHAATKNAKFFRDQIIILRKDLLAVDKKTGGTLIKKGTEFNTNLPTLGGSYGAVILVSSLKFLV